jgi:hypothetical protein
MIYPKKNKFISWFLQIYAQWITSHYFHAVNFNTIAVEKDKAVLLIANHFSRWDALVLYRVNQLLLNKKFHVMILEETVEREVFLKYGGAFSINKTSKNMVQSLDFAVQLLNDPENLVLIFPQGKLYSNFVTDIVFEKGIFKIIKQATNFQLLFAAIFIENFQHKKPCAAVYLKTANNNFSNIDELQQAYQQHYIASRLQQTQIIV